MSEKVKGYVVRGKDNDGIDVYADEDGSGDIYCNPNEGTMYTGVHGADMACAARAELARLGCANARVFAVAEDGTETPLPTYEEALATLDAIRRTIPEDLRADELDLSVAALLGERRAMEDRIQALLKELDAVSARGAAVSAALDEAGIPADAGSLVERVQLLAKDADEQTTLTERRTRDAEEARARVETINKAWARLYDASENVWCVAIGVPLEADIAPKRAQREAAKQALRDLGVDVDALLKEAGR